MPYWPNFPIFKQVFEIQWPVLSPAVDSTRQLPVPHWLEGTPSPQKRVSSPVPSNDMRLCRITSRPYPWPLLATAKIHPVLARTRTPSQRASRSVRRDLPLAKTCWLSWITSLSCMCLNMSSMKICSLIVSCTEVKLQSLYFPDSTFFSFKK